MKVYENGKFTAALVYGTNMDSTDYTAVSEVCLFTRLCTNKDYVAYGTIPSKYENFIFVGADNEFAKKLGITVPREKFTDDTVYILVKDNYIVLDGGKRGKLYAVYEYFERFWGVRFYTPEKSKTPLAKVIDIPEQEIIYTPPFKIRNVYATDNRWDREFAARSRINASSFSHGLHNFGGSIDFAKPDCHTTFKLFFPPEDPDVGFAVHPEYYAYSPKLQKRVGRHTKFPNGALWGEGEICWTNSEVIEIIIKKLKQWVLDDPDMSIFSISMNDWGPYCECEECSRIANEQAVDGEPRWIAPILYCLNKVGKAIKEWQKTDERVKNRTIYIETLAYHQATKAPKDMQVEDNIIIRFCTGTCSYHQFDDKDCVINANQVKALEDWAKLTKNIFLWDYSDNHAMTLAYNTVFRVIQGKYKTYAKKGVVGVFNEFNASMCKASPWFYVRQYIYNRLLWNPDIDMAKEMLECMQFLYGEGAPYLMEFERRFNENFDKIAKKFEEQEAEEGERYHLAVKYLIEKMHFPDELVKVGEELFECALAKAKTKEHKHNIEREYLFFKWCKVLVNKGKDYKLMDSVLAEFEEYGITNGYISMFKTHFYGGLKDDYFRDSVAERNRQNFRKKLSIYM